MTPEERYNQQVWEILQDIKEELLVTVSGKPVEFRVPDVIGGGIIPKDRQINILYKLEEENALTIHKNAEGVKIGPLNIFYLFIDPTNFNIVYDKYQRACNLNSYLDEYGKSLYKGEKIHPKFSVVSTHDITNKSLATQKTNLEEKYQQLIDEIKGKRSKSPNINQTNKTYSDIHPISHNAPYTIVEKSWGYLKFGKYNEKKKIGRMKSRHFKLLQSLLSPINTFKTTTAVFEAIRSPNDTSDARLNNMSTKDARQVELIQFAIKELQKDNKLDGKIEFEFNYQKDQIRAVVRS